MDSRVADHAALMDVLAASLELRLDQGNDGRAGLQQVKDRWQHQAQRDEGDVDDRDVGRSGKWVSERALVRSIDTTRGSVRSL